MTIMEEETAQRIATALEGIERGIERALQSRTVVTPQRLGREEIEAEIARITATMGREQ
jgi:hypothetical protein